MPSRELFALATCLGLISPVFAQDQARGRDDEQAPVTRPAPAPPEAKAATLKTSIGLTLKQIPRGSFTMGPDPSAALGEGPGHRVTITRPFYLGVYEVTQHEYEVVMGKNPSIHQGSDRLPVESVNWVQAVIFCNKLSEREGRKPYYRIGERTVVVVGGNGFRLPTEAEWEYAARAGSPKEYPFKYVDPELGTYAWYSRNSDFTTHPVGEKEPNAFGLYDTVGNVSEWTGDWFWGTYYKTSPTEDPPGASEAVGPAMKIMRGGSFETFAERCNPTYRFTDLPGGYADSLGRTGIRVAASQD